MKKFYGSFAYIGCGNGCGANLQACLCDESDRPIDTDWNKLSEIYSNHNSKCSPAAPYKSDENAFYGDPDECGGFVVSADPNSGLKYCEF